MMMKCPPLEKLKETQSYIIHISISIIIIITIISVASGGGQLIVWQLLLVGCLVGWLVGGTRLLFEFGRQTDRRGRISHDIQPTRWCFLPRSPNGREQGS